MATTIEVGTLAEYTCDETWGDHAGQVLAGDVVKAGKTYADVTWRESDRTERIHFRKKREMSRITFTPETPEQAAATRRALFHASYPFLPRRLEQRRIELEHDDRADLVHQGRRTSRWYRTVAAVLRARIVEIDRMVAVLRSGDQVRQADDPAGTVWTIREVRDGNDGWVWLGLRRTPENDTEIWTGCRARGVDLVASATDAEHTAELETQLREAHRNKLISDGEYAAGLERIHSRAASNERPEESCDNTPSATQPQPDSDADVHDAGHRPARLAATTDPRRAGGPRGRAPGTTRPKRRGLAHRRPH